jgi:large subunit ribosomal protein L1
MPQIASTFGRVLGPKGKMPNPKAGCIVPPKAALKPLVEKLQNIVHVTAKVVPIVQCKVGNESMSDDALAANMLVVYDQLVHVLPASEQNVKAAFVKLTMGAPVRIMSSAKATEAAAKKTGKAVKAAKK